MKVFCEVLCSVDEEHTCSKVLWLPMEMPVILPVGSYVNMPTPSEWAARGGLLLGRIDKYTLTGEQIECTVTLIGASIGGIEPLWEQESHDLLEIGYARSESDELRAACESMER